MSLDGLQQRQPHERERTRLDCRYMIQTIWLILEKNYVDTRSCVVIFLVLVDLPPEQTVPATRVGQGGVKYGLFRLPGSWNVLRLASRDCTKTDAYTCRRLRDVLARTCRARRERVNVTRSEQRGRKSSSIRTSDSLTQ